MPSTQEITLPGRHRFGKKNPAGIPVTELLTPQRSLEHWRHRRVSTFRWFVYQQGNVNVIVPEIVIVLFMLLKG